MSITVRPLAAALVLATLALPAQAAVEITTLGPFTVSFDGQLQADSNWFDNDVADLNGSEDSNGKDKEFELRRAELALSGKSERMDWVLAYDAKADRWLDANLKWKTGVGALTIGQYKQPNSLDILSSTKTMDFIASAMVSSTFGLSRRLGVAWGQDEKRWGYSVSALGRELTRNKGEGQGYAARAYYLPFKSDDSFLHLGGSLVDYDTVDDTQRWRAKPDADLASVRLIDTGTLADSDRNRSLGLEAVWARGPLKLQTEYLRTRTKRTEAAAGESFSADGWYVSGVWNLSGEGWTSKRGIPAPGKPSDGGEGMWQVGLRYDALDLNDGAVRGGEQKNLTLGLNYYWRSNVKLMANYVAARSSRFDSSSGSVRDDNPGIFETRVQFYW